MFDVYGPHFIDGKMEAYKGKCFVQRSVVSRRQSSEYMSRWEYWARPQEVLCLAGSPCHLSFQFCYCCLNGSVAFCHYTRGSAILTQASTKEILSRPRSPESLNQQGVCLALSLNSLPGRSHRMVVVSAFIQVEAIGSLLYSLLASCLMRFSNLESQDGL